MHGPTCTFWANLTPFLFQMAEDICRRVEEAQTRSPELGAAHSGR